MSKESPLSSVCVARQDQVDGIRDERKILGVMRKQDVVASTAKMVKACCKLGENRAGVHTCIPGEGAQCRIVAEEQDSENWEYRSAG